MSHKPALVSYAGYARGKVPLCFAANRVETVFGSYQQSITYDGR